MSTPVFPAKAKIPRLSKKWQVIAFTTLGLAVILAGVFMMYQRNTSTYATSPGDWPTYMYNNGRSGYNTAETIINPTSASNLTFKWMVKAGSPVFSQPVTSNGVIYWGSFDGFEHATTTSGSQIWTANLGHRTTCAPTNPLGIVSSATVLNGVVYVGGGNDYMYALNTSNGSVIWKTPVGDPSTNTFIWDSPLVYNGSVYIGAATTGEAAGCKLVPGLLLQLDAATGQVEHSFYTEPPTCAKGNINGGGIWASPTLDPSDGSLYIATGTEGHCPKGEAIGVVKLSLTDLTYESSWVIPLQLRVHDSDFGATPMLFNTPITVNGVTSNYEIGIPNKNGIYYALDRTNLSNSNDPLWSAPIAKGGACPQCGEGSISSSVYDGTNIYVAGGHTQLQNGSTCKGAIRAMNPSTGAVNGHFVWETCLYGTVMGAITMVPGVLAVVDGTHLTLISSKDGTILKDIPGNFYGSPTISNGVLYVGSSNGFYAYGISS